LLQYEPHHKFQTYIKKLNLFYKSEPALFEKAFSGEGFEWISLDDNQNSVISFIRKGHDITNDLVILCNFTPKVQNEYTIGIHQNKNWKEVFNSDIEEFYGSDIKNEKIIKVSNKKSHNKNYSLSVKLPPLSVLVLKQI